MKNIIFTLFLLIVSTTAFADGDRKYSIDRQSINNVDFKQKYTVKTRYTVDGSTMQFIPSPDDFRFDKFIDTNGYVKNVTANGSTLQVEFYRRKTAEAITGSVNLCFYAKSNDDTATMLLYSIPLQYSYSALTAVDPGEIAGPTDYYNKGERPAGIISLYDAIPLKGTTITYTWEKRQGNGSWDTIEGASSSIIYPDTIGMVSDYYRRKATDSAGNSAYSNTVEVLPMPEGGEIGIEYNDDATTLALTDVTSPNSTGAQISWQSSVDLETWIAMSGNTKSITTVKPNVTTYYRRKITTLANDSYGNPIVAYSNIVCYSLYTPECISTKSYFSSNSATTENAYFDGLGRKLQTVAAQGTMDGKDIVVANIYDNRGRETGTYVPFCKTGNGEFAHNAGYKSRIYHGDRNAATLLTYDNSPLDRIARTYKPGEAYQESEHYTATEYGVNKENEVIKLKLAGNGFKMTGYHTASTLYWIKITDEDGASLTTFADSHGKTILERRTIDEGVFADTYYIYDSKNRLTAVVSPEGSAMLTDNTQYSNGCNLAKEYCYIYSYDSEDRIVMKRLPGRCAEFFEYNTQGRLSKYYDEAMLLEGISKCYTYDVLGRVAGFRYESDKGACCQQRYYYDDYSAPGVRSFRAVNGIVTAADLASSVKGKLTHERTFELYNEWASEARERTYYYDKRGRCVQIVTAYPVGISCRMSVKYDYAGNPLKTFEEYSGVEETLQILTECTFDSRGRKLTERTSVNGTEVGCATFTYDELGRVTKTRLGDRINITAAYNLQGWLTNQSGSVVNNFGFVEKEIFDEYLRHYSPKDSLSTPRYSGKITEQEWIRELAFSGKDRFLYRYDSMGRLTNAEHRITMQGNGSTAGIYREQIAYDKNGNILSHDTNIEGVNHRLNYTYNGNHVASIARNDVAVGTAEYDSRGNITKIPGKDLQIAYNLCNLPQSITAADGTKVNYSYFSDGSKFRAVSDNGEKLIYAGSLRLKIDNYNSVPESFAIAGGRVKYDNGSWQTEYYITDHLGSVRAVTDTLGNVLATFDYTPYGELLAATDNTATVTDHLFTGKEQQSKLGVSELYDSKARFMGTDGRFLSIDPLAEKYYHLSPYAYCAADPVNLVDPDGRKWKTDEDKNKANKIKKDSEKKLNKIQQDINKAQTKLNKKPSSKKRQSKLNMLKQQEKQIMSFIDGIDKLTTSSNTYTFIRLSHSNTNNPNLYYRSQDIEYKRTGFLRKNDFGEIEINYIDNSSNIYHETQHAIQHELGKLKIFKDQYVNTSRETKLRNEVEAYQIEYIFNSNFNPALGINSFGDINIEIMEKLGY